MPQLNLSLLSDSIHWHQRLGLNGITMFWMGLFLCATYCCLEVGAATPNKTLADTVYEPAKDSFYRKTQVFATWIMIWNGSTEKGWWKASDYHGCKVEVDGTWQSIDWNNKRHIDTYCQSMLDAGINVILVDFTNGFRWQWQAERVQQFCHDHGMKFAVAFNPQGGKEMEVGCEAIWQQYAAPGKPLSDSYLYKDGKPLILLYTTREGYKGSLATEGSFRTKFSTAWASGEDSEKDKWGWQLDPAVGPVASKEAMYLTSSVKFGSPKTQPDEWRRNLSWLDYGMIIARRNSPKYVIVGSFDDVHERNAWLIADTENAPAGWQMRDKKGAISPDAYYTRVREWLKRSPSSVEGGLIPDGAYLVRCSNGNLLGAKEIRQANSEAMLTPYRESIDGLIWFYHLGGNDYRLVKLNAGMSLESKNSNIILNLDSKSAAQRWRLEKNELGFRFLNQASGEALAYSVANVITEARSDSSSVQFWSVIKQATVDELQDKPEGAPKTGAQNPAGK